MLIPDVVKGTATIRGIRVNNNKISFIALLGEADGGLIEISQQLFFRALKRSKKKILNILDLEGQKCEISIINVRKIEFTGFETKSTDKFGNSRHKNI